MFRMFEKFSRCFILQDNPLIDKQYTIADSLCKNIWRTPIQASLSK